MAKKATTPTIKTLFALRGERGYANRTEFAKAIGVDRFTTWRWETGRQQPSARDCRRIANLLGVSMETVLDSLP